MFKCEVKAVFFDSGNQKYFNWIDKFTFNNNESNVEILSEIYNKICCVIIKNNLSKYTLLSFEIIESR